MPPCSPNDSEHLGPASAKGRRNRGRRRRRESERQSAGLRPIGHSQETGLLCQQVKWPARPREAYRCPRTRREARQSAQKAPEGGRFRPKRADSSRFRCYHRHSGLRLLLAVHVKCIVDRELERQDCMIVRQAHLLEAFSDRLEARRFPAGSSIAYFSTMASKLHLPP